MNAGGARKPRYVNLGCGRRYHRDWINFDLHPSGPDVRRWDLRRGIPLADASCDAVYHSAVIEHFRRHEAAPFLRECRRVLRPGGVVRVATPDLERICRLYLERLAACEAGDEAAEDDLEWMTLELLDQAVRESSGGAMLDFLRREPLSNEGFVLGRIGEEGRSILEWARGTGRADDGDGQAARAPAGAVPRWRGRLLRQRDRLAMALLGPEGRRALTIGRFRLSGEVHAWLYDRHSLNRLLCDAGFVAPCLRDARTSAIPGFAAYHLDAGEDGMPVKPDSFYMEAVKPV